MTPPRQKRARETRRRILETASEMMAERGPDAVSMREISARLKITKPVLYYYFRDKEALIKAAFEEGTKHFSDLQVEMDQPGLDLEGKLEKIFASHLKFINRYPEMPKCALKIMASPAGGTLAGLARGLKERNRAALRAMLKKESFSPRAAEDIVHMISSVITYFMVEAREKGAAAIDRSLPRRLARIICAGTRSLKSAAAVLLLLPSLAAAEPLRLGVDQAVELALERNTDVVNAEHGRLIYKEKIREYWGTLYPQLSAAASYTRNIEKPSMFFGGNKIEIGSDNAYAASLDLDQVLWAGGKVATGIKMAGIYSDSSAERLRAARNTVRKAVTQMYYSVLLSRAMADIQEETLELSRQHLSVIETRYRQGLASDLALLRQRVEVSNNEPAVTQNLNYYEAGLLALKDLLGLSPDAELELTGAMGCSPAEPAPLDELYRAAMAARPEYRLADLEKRLAAQNVTLEKAGHYPYLNAFASRSFQGQTDDSFPGSDERSWALTAGVRLNLPLFSGGSVSSRVKQADLALRTAEENLASAERGLKITVKKAWLELREASQRLASQAAAVETARKALAATELRFKSGLAGQLDLNDATLALNRAQTLYTQAQHDVCSASAELDWAAGK
ncbi:MAG TPA: TolC family protein [Elusimicrobiales bacterium]|nr:TolC family protein [Elusimicrobiales bacterium]